ncbi:MAG: MBL fold metallo-hydrolase, partial [Bacteroidetes bacterium]
MRVTILGSGTSQGVPVIGCDCAVCTSTDVRDQRLRCAVLVESGTTTLVIDVGPDFRQQMLGAQVHKLDAVLLTHEHNDHIIGMDDLRPFVFRQQRSMPIYCTKRVARELRQRFAYAFAKNPYPGAPRFELRDLSIDAPFIVGDIQVQAIEYLHGQLPVVGFRIKDFAYLTDFKSISDSEFAKLAGLDTLIVSALHHDPHHSHANLREALALIGRCHPRTAYLTHISHRMGLHAEIDRMLPAHIQLVY